MKRGEEGGGRDDVFVTWLIYSVVSGGFFNFLDAVSLLRRVVRFLKPIFYVLLTLESVKDTMNRVLVTGASARKSKEGGKQVVDLRH